MWFLIKRRRRLQVLERPSVPGNRSLALSQCRSQSHSHSCNVFHILSPPVSGLHLNVKTDPREYEHNSKHLTHVNQTPYYRSTLTRQRHNLHLSHLINYARKQQNKSLVVFFSLLLLIPCTIRALLFAICNGLMTIERATRVN